MWVVGGGLGVFSLLYFCFSYCTVSNLVVLVNNGGLGRLGSLGRPAAPDLLDSPTPPG
jgi:hypothetical protein